MTRICTALIGVALGLAILMTATFEVTAQSGLTQLGGARVGGRSLQSFHSPSPVRPWAGRRHGFRHLPVFDGFVSAGLDDVYAPGYSGGAPYVVLVSPPEPPHSVTCKRSQETVEVPSEDGGTRKVTITRC